MAPGFDKGRRKLAGQVLAAVVLCLATAAAVPLLFEWDARRQPFDPLRFAAMPPASPQYLSAEGRLLRVRLAEDDHWRIPLNLVDFNPRLLHATLAAEDHRFYRHRGVDWPAALRAVWQNFRGGGVRSGASTLTMQVVKLAAPRPRSLSGKLAQAADAVALERHWSKDEILCAYLNRAPYGGNLSGAEAAARRYFGKSAAHLTLPESALLAALPKSPTLLNPYRNGARLLARRDHVLDLMHAAGFITEPERDQARATPLGIKVQHPQPRAAAHLVARLSGTRPEGATLTLDSALQLRTEDLLRSHLLRFDNAVGNGAAIIVRVPDRAVLAYAGGADFWAERSGAQVDLATAPRSPGSALKPFLYALALEQQRLYPAERLLDDTLDFGRYAPANFEDAFNGLLRADEALRYSLNVPAVLLQERLGTQAFLAHLREAGFSTLHRSAEDYGLGLCIGNGEVRLDELAAAYAALADGGRLAPLRLTADTGIGTKERLISADSAYLLWTMLEQAFPWEKGGSRVRARGGTQPVAWKTGTSTGFHDAWAVAYNRHYVVAVWLGNSDGVPSRRLVGAEAALPLAARLFRGLPPLDESPRPNAETALREVRLCAASGLHHNPHCPNTATVRYPESVSLHRTCRVHVPAPDGGARARWPALAKGWDAATLPPAATQRDGGKTRQLAIQAPADGSEFVHTGQPGGDRIRLRATQDRESPVHWYLNGSFLGTSAPDAPLFLDLSPGAFRLSCMTPEGSTAAVNFEVHGTAMASQMPAGQ